MLKVDEHSILVVPEEAFNTLTYNLTEGSVDSNICIILSNEFMSYHNQWKFVSVGSVSNISFLRLCICLPYTTNHTLIITSGNLFNLNVAGNKLSYSQLSSDLILASKVNKSLIPHTASCVVLTRGFETHVKDRSLEEEILINHFSSHTRYLCVGDVFSVDTRSVSFGTQHVLHDLPSIAHYCVINIIGTPYETEIFDVTYCYAISPVTKFQINSPGNFFLPPTDHVFLNNNNRNVSVMDVQNSIISTLPTGLDTSFDEIKSLIHPFLISEKTDLNMIPLFLLTGKRGSGKTTLLQSLSKHYGLNYIYENCVLLQTDNPVTTETGISNIFQKLTKNAPCLLHFRHIEVLCSDEAGNPDHRIIDYFLENLKDLKSVYPFVIFCTSTEIEKLEKTLHRSFLQTVDIGPLDGDQRLSILKWILASERLQITQSLDSIIPLTSSFVFADFIQLVSRAAKIRLKISSEYRIVKSDNNDLDCTLQWQSRLKEEDRLQISADEIKEALDEMNANYSKSIGAPEMQNVTWDDIGGLSKLKEEILTAFSTTNVPAGLQRSGLLLHGPPGTGKTLLAKAVATHFKYNFLSVKGPELLNMWVGQSEENVRQVFSVARASAPCIIFFDELDSLAPKRGESGGGGGVMDRVVSQLLAEMDGIQKKKGVFILAATNRSDLIDSALLRPGRLDKMLFVGSYNDEQTRLSIMKALTRKFNFADDVDFTELLNLLPTRKNITGADFYGICSKAWLNAARRHINDSNGDKQKLKSTVLVSSADMIKACAEFIGISDDKSD